MHKWVQGPPVDQMTVIVASNSVLVIGSSVAVGACCTETLCSRCSCLVKVMKEPSAVQRCREPFHFPNTCSFRATYLCALSARSFLFKPFFNSTSDINSVQCPLFWNRQTRLSDAFLCLFICTSVFCFPVGPKETLGVDTCPLASIISLLNLL